MYDDDLRHRLVAAAAAAVAEGGVESVSLRSVAREAGTSTNAVYTLFGNREALLSAAVAGAVESFFAAQAAVRPTGDALADLFALGDVYRRWALAEPTFYTVMFGGRTQMPGATDFTALAEGLGPIIETVRRCVAEGSLTCLDPHQFATLLWSTVHGFVSLEISQWGQIPLAERDALYDVLQQSFIRSWMEAPVPRG